MSSFKKSKNSKRELLKTDFLRSFHVDQRFQLNEHHKTFVETAFKNDTNIVFVDGPAGSNKTYLATYVSLELIRKREVDNLIYIRSIVESASRKLGSLPGEADDKFKPWSIPLVEKCDELINKSTTDSLIEAEIIKCTPVNFLRGSTFNDAAVIVDEAQNLDLKEIITILTRFGKNCRMFVIGDTRQSDIHYSGFAPIMQAFNTDDSKEKGIHTFHFGEEDITRSKLLKYIVCVLKNVKAPNYIKNPS